MDNTKTAEEILKKHCHSMDDLFLDYSGRQFRDRIVLAMEEYASPLKKRIEELEQVLFVVQGALKNNGSYPNTVKTIEELLNPSTNGKQG